jgi:hypothetical protein
MFADTPCYTVGSHYPDPVYKLLLSLRWTKLECSSKPEKGYLMVYNEDRSISGYVSPSEEIYEDLFKAGSNKF